MKRLVLVLMLLAAAAVLALPGPVGRLAQQAHDRELALAGRGEEVTLEAYERGWFTTRARHRVSLSGLLRERALLPANARESVLIIESEARHGLLPLGAGAPRPGIVEVRSTLALEIGEQTLALPGEVRTRLSPAGNTTLDYRAQAGTLELHDGGRIAWEPAVLQLSFDRAFSRAGVSGTLGRIGMETGTGDSAAFFGPASLDARQTRRPGGLWTGHGELRFDTGLMEGPVVRDAVLRADVGLDDAGGGASAGLAMSAAQIVSGHWRGENARVKVRLERMDEGALPHLGRVLGTLARTLGGDDPRALQLEVISAMHALASAGIDAQLEELHVPSPAGDVEARGRVSFARQDPAGPANPYGLLDGASGEFRARVPVRLMIDTARRDPAWMENFRYAVLLGVLEPDARHYKVDARYGDGTLHINGRSLPFPF